MASNLYDTLKNIEKGRQNCIKNAKLANLPATDNMDIYSIGDLFLQKNTEETIEEEEWIRPTDWWDTKTILDNAQTIIKDGNTYYPTYILLISDETDETTISKSSNANAKTYGDAFVFSDEPDVLYVGDTIHIWDKSKDKECSEGYKTRYIIVYMLNVQLPNTANTVYLSKFPCIEIILGSIDFSKATTNAAMSFSGNYSIINFESTEKTIWGNPTVITNMFSSCYNIKQINFVGLTHAKTTNAVTNACNNLLNFLFPDLEEYIDTYGSASGGLLTGCPAIKKCVLPKLKNFNTRSSFINSCHSLKKFEAPELETITGDFNNNIALFYGAYTLETIELPKLKSVINTGGNTYSLVNNCYSLKRIILPLLETWISGGTNTSTYFIINAYALNTLYMPELKEFSITNFIGSNTYSLRKISIPKLQKLTFTTSGTVLFGSTTNVKEFILPDTVQINAISNENNYLFYASNAYNSNIEISNVFNGINLSFSSLSALNTIKIPKDWKANLNIGTNVNNFYHSSLIAILTNLADVTEETEKTYTLTLGATNLAKLTAEEIAIGTNKGWTIV